MASRHAFSIVFVVIVLIAAGSLFGQEPVQINYQGRLTNSGGTPLTGSYNLTFTLYDGSTPVWVETQSAVPVTSGLFTVRLGALTPLYDTLFKATEQWLGIRVGNDFEISPRTRLTAFPIASAAHRVLGSVTTGDGELVIQGPSGNEAVSVTADLDSTVLSMDWNDPSSKLLTRPGLRFRTGAAGTAFNLFNQDPAHVGDESFRLRSRPDGLFEAILFDPQPEPPGKLFELAASAGSGPSMSFFDQAGQVMGIEPVPWNTGFSIKMFDPQPEPPGKLFEINTSYGTRAAATTFIMSAEADAGYRDLVRMTADAAGGEIRVGPGADGAFGRPVISGLSDLSQSTLKVMGAAGATSPPTISLVANSSGPRIGIGTDAPSQALHVVGNICYTGTIGACSDEKFKKDIEPIDGALPLVGQLDGVRYSWRTDEYPDQQFSNERQVGFVAQDVQQVLPEAVTTQEDGSLTVDYSRITPLLVQAIKELKAENEALKKRLEKLEKK